MSEPRSLYLKIKTNKENLNRFFQDKPLPPEIDQDWTAWWNSRKMHSKSPLTKVPVYAWIKTNRGLVDSYLSDPQTGTREQVSEEGEWELAIALFSQNYTEILPMLAWLKSIASYMEAGDEGVAIIYDYFWGSGNVMMHMEFTGQQATFRLTNKTSEIDPKIVAEANDMLKNAIGAIR
ncbi:hypothetical protein [Chitinophaga filiformis]|uniref:Uncharacterized protein n=1 Tax=Chitinophaga filiformis TaxID=104663 RepID=A0A1G7LKA2_CHIFI|nr:hypothetical protein [Chitinophaga filiformis]SDF49450.1 hypothetical protein SAMN04488121_10283 [Chitinophaga filiformis]